MTPGKAVSIPFDAVTDRPQNPKGLYTANWQIDCDESTHSKAVLGTRQMAITARLNVSGKEVEGNDRIHTAMIVR